MRYLVSAFFITTALFLVTSVDAQEFPSTEKEVKEILCTGSWTLDSLGRPGKMRSAAEAQMDGTTLTFKEDGTYIITVFGKDKPGKWTLDMADKQVNMFEKTKGPDSIIKGMSKDQLVMSRGDGSDLKMVFRPDK